MLTHACPSRPLGLAPRTGAMPDETWDDGLAVTEVLMACYLSAERGAAVHFPEPELESFVPAVARGEWRG
jgi:hypothetical protein